MVNGTTCVKENNSLTRMLQLKEEKPRWGYGGWGYSLTYLLHGRTYLNCNTPYQFKVDFLGDVKGKKESIVKSNNILAMLIHVNISIKFFHCTNLNLIIFLP